MKSKAIFMALLAFAFTTQAEPVLLTDAQTAAENWASGRRTLGARIGTKASFAVEHRKANGEYFYAVRMQDGGTVFLSGDTTLEPILAFTSSGDNLPVVLKASNDRSVSPLEAMLNARCLSRETTSPNSQGGVRPKLMMAAATSVATVQPKTAAERKWAKLLRPPLKLAGAAKVPEVDDVRVAPLLRTKWGQGVSYAAQDESAAVNCFNYYTPTVAVTYKEADGSTTVTNENCVCGCVATAMAQLMRYWESPGAVGNFDNSSFGESEWLTAVTLTRDAEGNVTGYDGRSYAKSSVMHRDLLKTTAGAYDWANMTDFPLATNGTNEEGEVVWVGTPVTEENCRAIGKLTYDCGVSVGMSYNLGYFGGSGLSSSYADRIPTALMSAFGYAQARFCNDWSALSDRQDGQLRARAICANLDAGCPVLLLISGGGGHAVVGDGYGFSGSEQTPYVHLNMGWSGQCDVWYNLPLVETGDNPEKFEGFVEVDGVVYNVNPTSSGFEIVSGRVSEGGVAASGLPVRLYADGEEVDATTTSDNGVYSFFVEPGRSYVVRAANDAATAEAVTPVIVSSTEKTVGNSWGNDLTLTAPAVTVGSEGYASVDAALEVLAAGGEAVVRTAAKLDGTPVIAADCSMVGAADNPADNPVVMGDAASLTVANGGCLVLSNLAFVAASGEPRSEAAVTVAAGGRVRIAGPVDFAVAEGVAAIETADAHGLVLDAVPPAPLAVSCAAATGLGDVFARVGTNFATPAEAETGAILLRNAQDETLFGHAVWTGDGIVLTWVRAPVPLEDATCYLVDSADNTNTAASVEEMLALRTLGRAEGRLTGAETIVIRKSLKLTSRLIVGEDLDLCAEEGLAPTVTVANVEAGFTVTNGTLCVRGLAFSEIVTSGLLVVDGTDAVLELRDCAFADLVSCNVDGWSSAVQVLRGGLDAADVKFERCVNAQTLVGGRGGAISAAGDGCDLSLSDVTMTDCRASDCGGGVFAGSNALLRIQGAMQIRGNVASDGIKTLSDDVFVEHPDVDFQIASLVPDVSAVGVRYGGASHVARNHEGDVFATYVGPEADVTNTAACLFNDVDDSLEATFGEASADGRPLVWSVRAVDRRLPSAEGAVVSVRANPEAAGYYASLADALAQVGAEEATIELLADVDFDDELVICGPVTLCSSGTVVRKLSRLGDASVRIAPGGSLTVSNLTVTGGLGFTGLFDVDGGFLKLCSGATVTDFNGDGSRDACAVVVSGGGAFEMESGSRIEACVNSYDDASDGTGRGAALLVDNGRADLRGGTITGCRAAEGAVFVGNLGSISVSGDLRVESNFRLDGTTPSNLSVHDLGSLVLSDELTGGIGYMRGEAADERVIGRVDDDFADDAKMASSAHRFSNDETGDIGMVVGNGGTNLLVWSSAIKSDGSFTDAGGKTYRILSGDDIPKYPETHPAAKEGLVYNGAAQIGVLEGLGYALAGVPVATNAGTYKATATLRPGFAWDDGNPSVSTQLTWTIAKAVYDLNSISFKGTNELVYTGTEQSLYLTGVLPEGVIATYENNTGTNVGDRSDATLTLTIDPAFAANYTFLDEDGKPVSEMELNATLVIVSGDTPVDPDPIAFQSIVQINDDEWRLVVTNRKAWANYRLLWTEDLTKGFTSTGAWEQAMSDGPWMTNVVFEAPAPVAVFWKAEAEKGVKP